MTPRNATLALATVAFVAFGFTAGCDATQPNGPESPAMSVTGGVTTQSSIIIGPTEVEAGDTVSYSTEDGTFFVGKYLEAEPAACFFAFFDPRGIARIGNEPLEGYWLGHTAEESDECVSPYTARIVARESTNGPIIDSLSVDVTGLADITL